MKLLQFHFIIGQVFVVVIYVHVDLIAPYMYSS